MKRCGPSSARYQMPPVFGYRDHDLRLQRAPAYSFGYRDQSGALQAGTESPGPANYTTADKTRFGKTASHAVGFNTREQKQLVSDSPAPNEYNNNFRTGQRPPCYTFGHRRNEVSEMGEC